MADPLTSALTQISARSTAYRLYRDYYAGKHRLLFATEKFRNAFGALFAAFACNLCPVVVDVPADRLTVTGFAIEGNDRATSVDAWALWRANRMDRRSGQVHKEALEMGDGYVIVWPDARGEPTIWPQRANGMTIKYDADNPGVPLWAAKTWIADDGRVRVNLYFPDRIEKYVTPKPTDSLPGDAKGFEPFKVQGEDWPLPNNWGRVPVFHFGNDADVGEFGHSELTNIIPLQDGLNKSICDRLVAQEFVAYPQRWAAGLDTDVDPVTGKAVAPFIPAVDRLWTTDDPNVKFGEFAAASLAEFVTVEADWLVKFSAVSGTPLHYFAHGSGAWPSGESMKTAEARLIAKVKDRSASFGNVWEDVFAFALMMQGTGTDDTLNCMWADPTPRNDKDFASTQGLKRAIGVSSDQVQREYGYSDEQIAQFKRENADDPLLKFAMPPVSSDMPTVTNAGRALGNVSP